MPLKTFPTAQDAWLSATKELLARQSVYRDISPTTADVLAALNALYRRRRLGLSHARILRIWGERGVAPSADVVGERADAKVWTEALERLDWPLRVKGIVA